MKYKIRKALRMKSNMLRRFVLWPCAALMSLSMSIGVRAQAEPDTVPSKPVEATYPGGVVNLRNVEFSILAGFRPITLDLYLPPPGGAPKPAVVFAHGGGWNKRTAREGGMYRDFPSVLASVAARGYVVASVNYRLSSEAKYPAQVHDMQNAIRWLRMHAAEYNVDVDHVAVWGSSAGSHLAALIGTSCGVAALDPPAPDKSTGPLPSTCAQAVIDWYGPIDFERMSNKSESRLISSYLGCEPARCPPGTLRATNPITYIDPKDPPFLIAHGTDDFTVPLQQAQLLHDALRAAGVSSQLVIYPGVAHGFAKMAPTAQPDDATNQRALADVLAFLERVFPKKQ
jgi:acetyl esterase/lipase